MEHVWSVLCQYLLISEQTRNPSLIEVVERLVFRPEGNEPFDYPIQLPVQLNLVSFWWRSRLENPEEGTVRIMIVDPNGTSSSNSNPIEYQIDLSEHTRFRATVVFTSIPFSTTGVYRFNIEIDSNNAWVQIGSVPIEIILEN